MKLIEEPRLPAEPARLLQQLTDRMRDIVRQVNALTEGRQSAVHSALPSAPTTGEWAVGDFVLNSAPTELGLIGSKYIVHGWRYLDSGFVECRYLTGN
jgi:hypothetical protein